MACTLCRRRAQVWDPASRRLRARKSHSYARRSGTVRVRATAESSTPTAVAKP